MRSLVFLLAVIFGTVSIVSGAYYLKFVRPDVLGVEETDKNIIKAWEFNNCGIMQVCYDTEGWVGDLVGNIFLKIKSLRIDGITKASKIFTEGEIPLYGKNVKLSISIWTSRKDDACCGLEIYTRGKEKPDYFSLDVKGSNYVGTSVNRILLKDPAKGTVITKIAIVPIRGFKSKDNAIWIDWIRIHSR